MGVPGFFGWLAKKYKNENLELINNNTIRNNVDFLLIDTNCLVHPRCQIVFKKYSNLSNSEIEEKMFSEIIEYIKYITEYIKPKKGIYIAIDGPVPMAKIKQQRERRFKKYSYNASLDAINKKYNAPIEKRWNNNVITPGTEFMDKLHNEFLKFINNSDLNIIYSSYKAPGEGEHKLLDFIKSQETHKYNYVIYGLDADLIFLSLITLNQIYLLRENSDINKYNGTEFILVDIDRMRQLIYLTFETEFKNINYQITINNVNKEKIICDFIFMCYFMGNDFLPHIQSLHFTNRGIEYLITKYIKTFININYNTSIKSQYIIDHAKINIDFLTKFLEHLSEEEHKNFKNHKEYRKPNNENTPHKREIFKFENLQFKIDDPIKLGHGEYSDYRAKYYKHYWNVEDDIEEFSKNLVKEFFIGLKWITLYYFRKCPSWEWFYPYDKQPFITDMYKYIKDIELNKLKFSLKGPIEPLMQLMIVLPIQESYLLPVCIQEKFKKLTNISYMYPTTFEQDFLNINQYWRATPILPIINIKEVKKIYNKLKDSFNEKEKSYNIIENNLIKMKI